MRSGANTDIVWPLGVFVASCERRNGVLVRSDLLSSHILNMTQIRTCSCCFSRRLLTTSLLLVNVQSDVAVDVDFGIFYSMQHRTVRTFSHENNEARFSRPSTDEATRIASRYGFVVLAEKVVLPGVCLNVCLSVCLSVSNSRKNYLLIGFS